MKQKLTEKRPKDSLFSLRRSLILSVISLVVCISMFVGTTFAWMTDSIKSGENRIVAGNLDVAINVYDSVSKAYRTIGNNSLFDVNEQWEPDTVKVAYVEIKNNGTIAIDYSFNIISTNETQGINVKNQKFLLSEYLVFNVIEIDKPDSFYDDKTAIEACKNIQKGFHLTPLTNSTPFAGGSSKYYAVIVYMPSDGDVDDVNYVPNGKPVLQLNISLIAKQSGFETPANQIK